ncbi:SulP family inorganic anion transporter [bacterium]|nr:SulP family inorganic anion transporter [bacterium]
MLKKIFPFISWFKSYTKVDLRADLISGITVAMVLIPQSMAYAQLAGLPPYFGLYASFLPPMIASLFGSSRQLATGPVAVVSLMTSASLEPLATAGSSGFITYAVMLALIVGIFQFALGLLRLGMVVNFLSHPVVNGFTNAAAIIIASSQLSKLFGVNIDNAEHHYVTVLRVLESAYHYTHLPTLFMSILAFVIMYGLRYINRKIPYVLIAVVVTTLISWMTNFEQRYKTSLFDIHSSEIQTLIHDFNNSATLKEELNVKRTELTSNITKVKKTKGSQSVEYLDLKHDIDVINLKIKQLKEDNHEIREELRLFIFNVEQGIDDKLRFYPIVHGKSKEKRDGKYWRLKVGDKILDEKSLIMFGGGEVVGVVPKGLPKFTVPRLSLQDFFTLLSYAVIISLLGFMEAISIAKAMAAKTGQFLDPNQELIGQGLANIVGSIGQSFPTSGSFSRSAVNLQSGAVSGLSSVFTSITVVIALLFFTPLLYNLPQATLAAIIMMAVIGLISISSFVHSWKTHRIDGIIQIITFICTLGFAPHLDKGIMIGVVLSLIVYFFRGMKPNVAYLSLHPDGSYRDAKHWGLEECKHIAMLRFDGPLFYANASYFEDLVKERINSLPELYHILLVANGINDMDASGEDVLALTVDNLRAAGIDFSMSGIKEGVLVLMKRTYLYEKIGEDHIFPTQAMAINSIFDKAHERSTEVSCPLVTVCFKDAYKVVEGEKNVNN